MANKCTKNRFLRQPVKMIRHLLALSLLFYCAVTGISSEECEFGQIRLINGTNEFEGVLEICLEIEVLGGTVVNRWWHLCSSPWSSYEAQVVCRQLGYSGEGVVGDNETLVSSSNVHQATYYCNGDETEITNCPVIPSHCNQLTTEVAPATVKCQEFELNNDFQSEFDPGLSTVLPSTTEMLSSTELADTTATSSPELTIISTSLVSTSTEAIPKVLSTTQELGLLITSSLQRGSSTPLPSLTMPTTLDVVSSTATALQSTAATNSFTPIEYALLFCTILAAVLFAVIVTLVAIAIWLARVRGNKQKHRRVQDTSVIYSHHHLSVEGEDEHNVDNPLYTDPNFLTMPRTTHINIHHQFERDAGGNNYETISDLPGLNRNHLRQETLKLRQVEEHSTLATEIQQLRTNEGTEDEYSHLKVTDIDYATLEPHIGKQLTHKVQRMEESDELDYSHLVR